MPQLRLCLWLQQCGTEGTGYGTHSILLPFLVFLLCQGGNEGERSWCCSQPAIGRESGSSHLHCLWLFPFWEQIHRDLERCRWPFFLAACVSPSASGSVGLFFLKASFQMQALLYRLFVALGGGGLVLCGLPSPQSPSWEAQLRLDIFLFPQRSLSPQWSP